MTEMMFYCSNFIEKFGIIRLEMAEDGLVLWVDGKIKWKSANDKSNDNRNV